MEKKKHNQNNSILSKALDQNEPKLILEYFLKKKEKETVRRALRLLIDSEYKFRIFPNDQIKQCICISKKIGLGQNFINELKDKLNS